MSATSRIILGGAWCCLVYCVLVLGGWWLVAGFFPLHEPSAGALETADFYRDDPVAIRAGMVMVMAGAAFFIPFVAALLEMIRKIEGRFGPLTTITGMAAFVNVIGTFYPCLIWLTAAFRPDDRPAELTHLVNDMAWLFFLGGLLIYVPIYASVAFATFIDRSEPRVFPRWYGYYTLFTGFAVLPDQLLFFFKTGPFAWNGLLAIWVPLSLFVAWLLVTAALIRRAVLNDALADSDAAGPARGARRPPGDPIRA